MKTLVSVIPHDSGFMASELLEENAKGASSFAEGLGEQMPVWKTR